MTLLTAPAAAGMNGYGKMEVAGDALVLLGSYTDHSVLPHWPRGQREGDGIVVCAWRDGRLNVVSVTPCLNPAFMKYHPKLNVLYVLSECIHTEGLLTAFQVDPLTSSLRELGRLSMTGRSSCYISFDRDARHAVITNYWDGLINVVALAADGAPLSVVQEHQQTRRSQWRQVANREDHMSNRQDGPHAHCNVFHPSYRWVFIPDLGDNCIHQYGWDAVAGRLSHQAHVPLPPGDGPRHFVFHPRLKVAYSGCELRSHVQVFSVDDSEPDVVKPRILPLQSLSTLPPDFEAINYVGEIKVSADGRNVYVSNRGHNSIATFAVNDQTGLLSPVGVFPTLGNCPRHFGISPCGAFVVVGDQDSDVVKVFKRCHHSGALTFSGSQLEVPCPNFVLFVQPRPQEDALALDGRDGVDALCCITAPGGAAAKPGPCSLDGSVVSCLTKAGGSSGSFSD